MIKQFRSSFPFGAQITEAGRAVRVARNLDHSAPFQVNQHLADPVATAAC
jgi:2,3-bisphosphoglycerate-independent phosphoglycerate mutase